MRQQGPVVGTASLALQPGLEPGSRCLQRLRFTRGGHRSCGLRVDGGRMAGEVIDQYSGSCEYRNAAADDRVLHRASSIRATGDTPQWNCRKGGRDPRCDSSDEPEHCTHRNSLLTAIIVQSVLSQPADNTSPTADKSREKPDKTHSETVCRVRRPQLNNK